MEVKTRIVCTIGDARKRVDEAKHSGNVVAYKGEVKKQLASDIRDFIDAGMNVARVNMAHYRLTPIGGHNTLYPDTEYLQELIQTIRDARKNSGKIVAIMGDIQGPKVRLVVPQGEIKAKIQNRAGSLLKVLLLKRRYLGSWKCGKVGEDQVVGMSWEGNFDFVRDVRLKRIDPNKDVEIHIGDTGPILRKQEFLNDDLGILCEVKPGPSYTGTEEITFSNGDGVSVKNSRIDPGIYELKSDCYQKDKTDLRFLLGRNSIDGDKLLVDFIALSFVKRSNDLRNLQNFIKRIIGENVIKSRFGTKEFPVISKIEDEQGMRNLSEIIMESYGIMVARGDLGLHCLIEKVPGYQKDIVSRCNRKERPVIVATQMLESMITNPEPYRAEVTDIYNAVVDGADALMLSGETAKGRYRKEAIEMMKSIIEEAEGSLKEKGDYEFRIAQLQRNIVQTLREERESLAKRREAGSIKLAPFRRDMADLERRENGHHIAYSACEKASQLGCSAIIALTESGGTARLIARFKPETRLVAGVYREQKQVAHILMLSYGVEPIVIRRRKTQFLDLKEVVRKANLLEVACGQSRRVITVAGYPYRKAGTVSFLNILRC